MVCVSSKMSVAPVFGGNFAIWSHNALILLSLSPALAYQSGHDLCDHMYGLCVTYVANAGYVSSKMSETQAGKLPNSHSVNM